MRSILQEGGVEGLSLFMLSMSDSILSNKLLDVGITYLWTKKCLYLSADADTV